MKKIYNLLKVAIKSIFKNRMRSLLTSLGIIIGVSAVIIMVAVGRGSQAAIEDNIKSLGTNLIIIFPGVSRSGGASMGAGSFNRFTMKDVETIKESATLISAISPVVRANGQVIYKSNNWYTSISGVSPDYFSITNWELESGEFFTERDDLARKKVALLGKTVATELFGADNPVGEQIRIRNVPFTVIGVLKEKGGSGPGGDQDDIILAPSTTVLYRLKGSQWIDMINASAISEEAMTAAQEEIRTILREAHRLGPADGDDFNIRTQSEIIDFASSTSKTMTLLLGAVACVSLVVGGIGIMNIMLVSVTERTREIGIRMSVGARASDILSQFLSEAVVLSLSGGIIGIILALAASALLNNLTDLRTVIDPVIVILAFTFSGAVGIFFGWYPARKAANLNPIDALRYE
ncbi:MAG: ABC transporter permease [Candidatus Marinimicrobia bacterium]|nr:ABC transporter permease [Candidatus Neomarinimicrobiota bacterium]HOG75783.1 ABC transporter permease [Candidatus Neomarinimicrobiota bacterium]